MAAVAAPGTASDFRLDRAGGEQLRLSLTGSKQQSVFARLSVLPNRGPYRSLASGHAPREQCSVHGSECHPGEALLFVGSTAFALSRREGDQVEAWLQALPQ